MPSGKNNQPVTKLEFNKGIEKLDQKINKVALSLVKTQEDVRVIQQTMATKSDVARILNAIDAFAGKAEAYDRKALSHGEILQNHEAKIRDHDRRLTVIESRP